MTSITVKKVGKQVNLKDIMPSEVSQQKKYYVIPLSQTGDRRQNRGCQGLRKGGMCSRGTELQFCKIRVLETSCTTK